MLEVNVSDVYDVIASTALSKNYHCNYYGSLTDVNKASSVKAKTKTTT